MTTTIRPVTGADAATQPTIDMGFTAEPFPANTHMCYIFNDEAERREVITRYINSGLSDHEFVGYFADLEDDTLVEDYLASMGIQPPAPSRRDHVLFCRAREVYCPDGTFTAQGMINRLRNLHNTCQAHHGVNLRVTGEMSWALSPEINGTDQLVEYESRINLLVETCPLTAICQYDANQFDGATLFEILQVHPMMVVRGQIVRNPYYIPALEYLTRHGLPVNG